MPSAILVYGLGFCLALTPWVSSAQALLLGLLLSLGFSLPPPRWGKPVSKWLMQASIVALGFAMSPDAVWRAGTTGVLVTAASIAFTLAVGWGLAKWLGLRGNLPALVTVGTAICGGSAIAAVGPTIGADDEEMAASLVVVFLLNAVALVVFPPLGHLLGMGAEAFGLFAAIAIHDTSSVVGAAMAYAEASVPIAVTVKLTRALWILPIAFAAAFLARRGTAGKRAPFPWFILVFIAAVGVKALFPQPERLYGLLGELGRAGLKGAIFLISAQLTRSALRRMGGRPLMLAVALWAFVIVGTLALLRSGLLHL